MTHDVNLLPDLSSIRYDTCEKPTVLCSEIDCFDGQVPYDEFADGAVAAKKKDWMKVNGYTLSRYNWDGEGNDLFYRFHQNNLTERFRIDGVTRHRLRRLSNGQCHCASTTDRTYVSFLDLQKISDRIQRLRLKKSTEYLHDGVDKVSFKTERRSVLQGNPAVELMQVSEPSPPVDSGLLSHMNVSADRQAVVLLFAYRDRKAHYTRMMKHVDSLRQAKKELDIHVYVIEQMNNDLFRKGW